MEAAAVGIPDERLGELVAAVVTLKDGCLKDVTEKGLIELASQAYVIYILLSIVLSF
jgi:acyl-CoA synthetase (AMP-forming)/AMP-acid ligase II